MASTALHLHDIAAPPAESEVSLTRLYVLRATYLLMAVGLGWLVGAEILSHPLGSRGIIPALLGGIGLLAILGIRYPLQMLPLLLFELAWKLLWVAAYGVPQWLAGPLTPVAADDMFATLFGVILMPLVIPWGYVLRRYVKAPADRWR